MNFKFFLAVIILFISGLNFAIADEGMWIVNELTKQNLARMKELGFAPEYQYLYDKDSACIADAVVVFGGGCTGITVSKDGLIFTNHHCGYGSIQKLSSVEHDYLKNGFISQSFADELPVKGLVVRYLKEIQDVSDKILPEIAGMDNEFLRLKAADSLGYIISKEISKDKFLEASVIPFYSMNKFYLVVYNVYRDVRLVFAPPTSLGKFGGDTDNWMWPRHTCDFSVFRVYANAENQPTEYSAENRPYHPKFVAEISSKGYQEEDYAMTIGFPGSTDRYLSSWGVEQRIESNNKPRIEVRGIKQNIWKEAMEGDDATRIKYASKYAGSSNYWKNSIGMNRGLARLHVIDHKQKQEAEFDKWAQKSENKDIYGKVLDILKNGYKNSDDPKKYLAYMTETFSNGAEIIRFTNTFNRIKKDNLSTVDIEDILNERVRPFFKDYDATLDQKVLAEMLKIAKEKIPSRHLPDIYKDIDKKYKGDYKRYVADLFAKTAVTSETKLVELLKDKKKYNAYIKKDPAALLAASVSKSITNLVQSTRDEEYDIMKGKRLYFTGLQKMYPEKSLPSDANFTMRLSYGSIKGYCPFDAAWYNYYTTQKGILEKEDSTSYEFRVQPEILEIVRKRDFGPYANERGDLQLCFLSNNDITGGNSGSPVFDKNGRVIGLAFDGNWEAMSGDIAFEPDLQRTISVDIRYVLWMIEKWGKSQRLIDELNIK
ncbi:MAG: S46 family peptidase [Tannerella sp.]|jgi:hypothetical protein|nr:S46 family peptidase [Tannerella sp.]